MYVPISDDITKEGGNLISALFCVLVKRGFIFRFLAPKTFYCLLLSITNVSDKSLMLFLYEAYCYLISS